MTKTVAEIAEGLGTEQRERLLSLPSGENRMGGYGADSGCPGLIERVGINHPIFGSHYRLTETGRQVAAHLKGTDHGNR